MYFSCVEITQCAKRWFDNCLIHYWFLSLIWPSLCVIHTFDDSRRWPKPIFIHSHTHTWRGQTRAFASYLSPVSAFLCHIGKCLRSRARNGTGCPGRMYVVCIGRCRLRNNHNSSMQWSVSIVIMYYPTCDTTTANGATSRTLILGCKSKKYILRFLSILLSATNIRNARRFSIESASSNSILWRQLEIDLQSIRWTVRYVDLFLIDIFVHTFPSAPPIK